MYFGGAKKMTLNKTASGTGLVWKVLFRTIEVEIGTEFDCIYSSKDKCIYVMQRDSDNQTIITVLDAKSGAEIDHRVYSHYFNSFFEIDGYAYMSYYSWAEQVYLQGRFMGNAGITGVGPYVPQ